MKKKLVTLLLAGVIAISATACGGSNEDSKAEETTAEATAEPTEEATSDLEEAIDEADQAIQDAADATGTDVTSVDDTVDAINEVAQGGGPATMDKYSQIENGMTYDEVKKIIGEDGVESVATENDATNIQIYQWAGEMPGSNITVSFQDDAVTSATQVGLD